MTRIPPPPMWKVWIARHALSPRWIVPASSFKLPAYDREHACLQAIRWVHSDAGVLPWKPFQRISLRHTTAKPAGSERPQEVATVTSINRQLELFDHRALDTSSAHRQAA